MSELNILIDEIMQEVDNPKQVVETEKTSSVKDKDNEFKTQVGQGLQKVASLCRNVSSEMDNVTYSDMEAFWEALK
jgi:hypothetical protein